MPTPEQSADFRNLGGHIPTATSEQPTNVRRLVFLMACGISFLLYLHRYTWGFIKKDVIEEFGWTAETVSWLDSLFPLAYGLTQIPSGMICDWFGSHILLGVSILLWSLSLGGIAFARDLAAVAFARVTFGVTQAACYPALNKISKNWFPIQTRTAAQGLIATFFGRAGGAISFILFGPVLMHMLGMSWRTSMCVLSAIGVVCGIAFLLLFRNTPREHPWANAAEAELISAGDITAAQATGSRLNWGAMARNVSMWFLLFRAIASNMADILYVYWLPLYLRDVKQLDTSAAGWLAALPLLGGAFGGIASGFLQTLILARTGNRRWARSSIGLIGKLVAAALMLASLSLSNPVLIACTFLVVKFFSDWEQPAEWGAASDLAGRNAATVFACVNTLGSIGGALAGPITARVLKNWGWDAVFILIAGEYLLAGLAWLFIDCTKPIEPAIEATNE